MGIRTLKDTGSNYPIPSNVDGATYALSVQDCVCGGIGDEMKLIYSNGSLLVTFNENSQAIIGGNPFWLDESVNVTLPANSTVYLCARVDPTKVSGQTGSFECLTESGIKDGNVNYGDIRDMLLYIVRTSGTGIISVVDKRKIITNASNLIKGILQKGSTSIALSSGLIDSNSVLSFYTSIYGVNPKMVDVIAGKVTLTFDAQSEAMDVAVKIERN